MRNLTERRQSQDNSSEQEWTLEELIGTQEQPSSQGGGTPTTTGTPRRLPNVNPSSGFGNLAITQYFKELMDEIGTSNVANYIKDQIQAAKDLKAQSAELKIYADALRDDPVEGTKKILVDAGEPTFDKFKQKAQDLRTGKIGTGFLAQHIAKLRSDLASGKIPKSPRGDIGGSPSLRQRVNTKDFYK